MFDEYSDNELVNLALDHNKDYFGEIMKRYLPRLRRYLDRLLQHNTHDVEECLSETFLKAYVHLATYSPHLSFSAWIYRIAHNQAIDLMRKNNTRTTIPIEEYHGIIDPRDSLEEKDLVEKILDYLPPYERDLLILYYIEQLSLLEISDIMKIKENTIAVQMKRTRDEIKKKFNF
jgi:RNA polymerase sigma-70 factor (ECF subfamily)